MNDDAVRRFFAMMIKREELRQRKGTGQPWPWTDDPILRDYKFTNVKRTDDKTTQRLVADVYAPMAKALKQSHPGNWKQLAVMNCAIARYFGTIEFMLALGWQNAWRPERIKALARKRLDSKQRVYTGAYLISPCNHTGPKENVVVDIFLADLWKWRESIVAAIATGFWAPTHHALQKVEGFGGTGFMAKETILDTRLVPGLWRAEPADRFTWTPVGPGSRRGAGRILGDDEGRAVNEARTLEVCRELFAQRRYRLPGDFVALELHDIQFQLCEFSKYEKVRLGQGRPRSVYRRPNQ